MVYLESEQHIFRNKKLRNPILTMPLYRLEKAILQSIATSKPEIAPALELQLEHIEVSSRQNTNAGFFTVMRPVRSNALIKHVRVLGNVFAKIEGMQNPMTFTLFVKDGIINTLEGASVDESTADIDFSIVKFEIVKEVMPH